MKQLSFLLLCILSSVMILCPADLFAQKQTFDLTTFTPPKEWKKTSTENAVQFTKQDAAKSTYCVITLLKSVPGTSSPKTNFDAAWETVVKEMVTASAAPEMQPAAIENGWEVQSGYAPFESDGSKGVVMLVTATSLEKMVNIIVLTNTDVYQKNISDFLESISLKKLEPQPLTDNGTDNASIIGTWGMSAGGNQKYDDYKTPHTANNYGYSNSQYTFNTDGTYQYVSKTFRQVVDKILLVKENGTYQVSGNNLTIHPQKSVIEAWSKKDGADKWGKLLSTQNRTNEKVTYQFTKHYFSGIQQWNLVLQANKATQRDGPFSSNTTFKNAYYYAPISANNTAIEFPGSNQTIPEITKEPVPAANTNNTALIGTWCIHATDHSDWRVKNGVMSTIFRQYTFAANSTYRFVCKTFDPVMNSIFLERENGTYRVNDDVISIQPQKSVLEEWSKKDNRDEWGKLLKTQNIPLEKATYNFSKNYIPDYNEWQLILKADKETRRDGPFNGPGGSKIWTYIITSAARPIIKLPG